MKKKRLKYKIFSGILSLCLIAGTLFTQGLSVSAGEIEDRLESQRQMEIQSNLVAEWPQGPVVSSESAILMEAETGTILYAKNIHEKEYPASTTKILTTLLGTELCSLDEVVTFSRAAVFDNPPGSSGIAMDVGQELTVEQCLNAILIRSANEVAFALAEHITGTSDWSVFADIMNARAKELGALNTHFTNPNGLPDEDHYTTAYDLAMIGRGFFANELLCKISITRRMEIPPSETIPEGKMEISSMQIIPGGKYEYEYLVGCKTGYTNVARSSLVSCAEKDGLKLICVVMKDESPLQYEDTISLFNYGFSNFTKYNIAQNEDKYNMDSTGMFYTENDIFGSSKSLLTLNKEDYLILPKNAVLSDTESTISYPKDDDKVAALIRYTYHGIDVGTARIDFDQDLPDLAGFELEEGESTTEEPKEETPVIFINILKILSFIGIGLAALGLIFLILKLFRSRERVEKNNRRTWKRNRRRRRRNNKYGGRSYRDLDF